MALMVKAAFALAAVYGLIVLGTVYLQRRLMYFPDTARVTPASVDLFDVEERVLETPDGAHVIAWWGRAEPGQSTLLYFHGNAGSLATRSERIRKYMAHGLGVFMMTYRGYGGSTGAPSEQANVADAKLAYDTLVRGGVDPADIILYGESLGSGIAVQVAAERRVGGLVLDAPFTSMVDLAVLHYPFIPARSLLRDRYETLSHIGSVAAPLLILHGEGDEIIPAAMGLRVYEAARVAKEIVTFPGAGHSDHHLFGSYDALFRWIDKLRSGRIGHGAE
ncbi:MAG TPA: alpha/beta fold hydrolase [Hyphomicrobiaceae bacterium]|nr:alpha/beta fold hydrolase [Hyphomicrobiaceae bacterium]